MAIDFTQGLDGLSDAELQAQLDALEAPQPDVQEEQVSAPLDFSTMTDEQINAQLAALEGTEDPAAPTAGTPLEKEEDVTDVPEQGFWEEVGDISADVGLQAVSGIRQGLIGMAHTVLPLYGIDPEDTVRREQFDEPEGTAGQVTKDVTRFITGYTVGGAPLKGMGMLVSGAKYVKALIEGSVRGFVGDYLVTSAEDKTMANYLKDNGADNLLVTSLAVNEDDSLTIKKLKGATEGVILGATLSSVFEYGLKPAAKVVFKADGELKEAIEEAFTISDEAFPGYKADVSDNGTVVMVAKSNRTGQDAMDDLQTTQIEETVDRKMKILNERRAAFDEEQALAAPLKTGESLKARKQAKKNLFIVKNDLKNTEKDIVKAQANFVRATERLEQAPIPKSVIDEDLAEVAVPGPKDPIGEGGSIYRELTNAQKDAVSALDTLQELRLKQMEDITGQQFILRELTEDAQAAAALRNKEALRINGPIPPQYEEITLKGLEPLATNRVDPAKKARAPRRVSQPGQRLPASARENPLPTNEFDVLVEDAFNLPRPIERIQAKLREVGSIFILRSADSMKSLAKVSPSAARLANKIRFDTSSRSRKAGKYSYTESVQFMSGRYKAKMKDVLADVLGDNDLTRFGNLTREANRNIVRALRGIDTGNIPAHHLEVAKRIRTVLNGFHGEAGEDIPTGFVENFFPRKWRAGTMHKNQEGLRTKLANAGHSPERIEEIERKLINEMEEDLGVANIIGTSTGDFSWKGSKFLSSGSRSVEIDELDFEEFLDDDLINVLDDYFERGSRKVTYDQMFGYTGDKVRKDLEAIVEESRANGRPIQEQETIAITKLLRNLQGQQRFGNVFDNVNEVVGTSMRIMHLGMATLASFGEAFIPFGKAGFLQASKGLLKAVTSVPQHYASQALRGVPEPEAYAAAQRVNLALDAAAAERLSSLFGGEVLTAGNRKVNNAFFKATLLTEWVKLVQVAAFNTGRSVITDNLTVLSKGSRIPGRDELLRRELDALGVDIESGLRWVRGGKNKDHPFMEMIERGSLRFANDSALNPDSAVKPFIQSRPEAMLLTQFKAYPTAFANIVLKDWGDGMFGVGKTKLQRGTKAVRATVATALITGATSYGMGLREYIQYGEAGNPHREAETDLERLSDIMDVSGLMGHAAIFKHAYDADRYNQEPVLAWFGPAVGKSVNLIRAAIDPDERQSILAKEAVRAIPNALPTEILMSYASNDGSKAVREQMRANLKSTGTDIKFTETEITIPTKTPFEGGGFNVLDAVKRLFPKDFKELFSDEDIEKVGRGITLEEPKATKEAAKEPASEGFGLRADGTEKGTGFLGVLKRPDGDVSTEISIGIDFGQGEMEIPLLVPTLSQDEIDELLEGSKPSESIVDKAVAHARSRLGEGLSPFAQPGEGVSPTISAEENAQIDAALPPTKETDQLLALQEKAKDFETFEEFEKHMHDVFIGDDPEFAPTEASFARIRPQLRAAWDSAHEGEEGEKATVAGVERLLRETRSTP